MLKLGVGSVLGGVTMLVVMLAALANADDARIAKGFMRHDDQTYVVLPATQTELERIARGQHPASATEE